MLLALSVHDRGVVLEVWQDAAMRANDALGKKGRQLGGTQQFQGRARARPQLVEPPQDRLLTGTFASCGWTEGTVRDLSGLRLPDEILQPQPEDAPPDHILFLGGIPHGHKQVS